MHIRLFERDGEEWNRRWDDWAQRKPNPQQTHTQLGFARLRLIRSLPLPTERRVCLHHNTHVLIYLLFYDYYDICPSCPWRKIGFLFRFEKIFFENAAPTSLWLRPKKLRLTSYKMCVCVCKYICSFLFPCRSNLKKKKSWISTPLIDGRKEIRRNW